MASARTVPMIARNLAALVVVVAAGASCGDAALEVVPYASVDQVFSEPIFRSFEEESGIRVRAVFDTEETKSTGVLNRIMAEAHAPQADVFWSGDPARAFVLISRGLVEPYRSPYADRIPPEFRSENDRTHRAQRLTFRRVVCWAICQAEIGPAKRDSLVKPKVRCSNTAV